LGLQCQTVVWSLEFGAFFSLSELLDVAYTITVTLRQLVISKVFSGPNGSKVNESPVILHDSNTRCALTNNAEILFYSNEEPIACKINQLILAGKFPEEKQLEFAEILLQELLK
jgi:hypothetical protein